MLVDFAVSNFRSIKDTQIFSMLPRAKVKEIESNVCTNNGYKILKTSIVYGGNGSGKSNLLMAFRAMKYLIKSSANFTLTDEIEPYEPFKLDVEFQNKPVELAINFYAKDGIKYNYYISFNKNVILKESLYYYPSQKPTKIFVREFGVKIDTGALLGTKYRKIEKTLYSNQLFLSKVGTEKIDVLIPAYTYLTKHFSVNTIHDSDYDEAIIRMITKLMVDSKNKNFSINMNRLLRASDVGIKGIKITENKEQDFKFPDSIDDEVKKKILNDIKYQARTLHDIYENGKVVSQIEFNLNDESTGTKKLMAFGGLIIDALDEGDLLIIDELDKSLHPLLTKALIGLFNNKKTNPHDAQLVIASHDVSLLDSSIFRRDQIWFAEKNEEGVSEYYSVSDIQNVRKNTPYDKWYLTGRFNGIPIINNLEFQYQ